MTEKDLAQIERALCEIEKCIELVRIDVKVFRETPRSKTFKFVAEKHIENLYWEYHKASKIIHA